MSERMIFAGRICYSFEEFNASDLKTVNGIAATGEIKAAWFKDSEGNILSNFILVRSSI